MGGVVGGLFVATCLGLLLFLRRRKMKLQNEIERYSGTARVDRDEKVGSKTAAAGGLRYLEDGPYSHVGGRLGADTPRASQDI